MRLSNEPGETGREHSVNPTLGLGEKSRAEENHHLWVNPQKAPESFFAVHERHGEIEQNQIEPTGALPKLFQTFEAGLNSGYLESGLGKNAEGQNAGGWLIIDNENSPRARRGFRYGNFRSSLVEGIKCRVIINFHA